MWKTTTDFLLKAHASGLGHDAVIEIMVALLGVMVAVLGILSVLVSLIFTALGIFGFQLIRDESTKAARLAAEQTAKDITTQTIEQQRIEQQAIDLSTQLRTKKKPNAKKSIGRKTSDAGLRGSEE